MSPKKENEGESSLDYTAMAMKSNEEVHGHLPQDMRKMPPHPISCKFIILLGNEVCRLPVAEWLPATPRPVEWANPCAPKEESPKRWEEGNNIAYCVDAQKTNEPTICTSVERQIVSCMCVCAWWLSEINTCALSYPLHTVLLCT